MKNLFFKSILLFFALFFVKHSTAQKSMAFDAGQMFSTFSFTNDVGEKQKDFSHNISGCYSLSYQDSLLMKGMFYRAGLSMRKAGASMILDGMDINWNLQYVDANVGIGYMLSKNRFNPYLYIAPYFGYMLKGNQTIGTYAGDIVKSKSMQTTDLGVFFSPGLKVTLSDYLSIYTEGKYMLGLQNIETTSGQKTYNRGFSINLGVAITLTKLTDGNKRVRSTL